MSENIKGDPSDFFRLPGISEGYRASRLIRACLHIYTLMPSEGQCSDCSSFSLFEMWFNYSLDNLKKRILGYGMTEVGLASHMPILSKEHEASVGKIAS